MKKSYISMALFLTALVCGEAILANNSSPASSGRASTSQPTSASKKKKSKKTRHPHEITQMTPAPERVSEIQSALARDGYYKGDPNGKLDANTVGALQKFQSAHNLEPTGKLDALSLQKMGLGSDIAGLSAPKPISQSGCCSDAHPSSRSSNGTPPPPPTSAMSESNNAPSSSSISKNQP